MDSTNTLGVNSRKLSNHSAMDKLKKKRKKKKKTKEGKRSSASSASASGSPDSSGLQKTQASFSSPSILEQSNVNSTKQEMFTKVNECLRWPAHSLYQDNAFRSEIIGNFPVAGATEEEEQERIEIYKMNRRKRYIAAQQAIIDKYPDIAVYASSSGSNSSQDVNKDDGLRMNGTMNGVVSSAVSKPSFQSNLPPAKSHENKDVHSNFFSNGDVPLTLSNSKVNQDLTATTTRRNVLSV